jgi:hypothetical protein
MTAHSLWPVNRSRVETSQPRSSCKLSELTACMMLNRTGFRVCSLKLRCCTIYVGLGQSADCLWCNLRSVGVITLRYNSHIQSSWPVERRSHRNTKVRRMKKKNNSYAQRLWFAGMQCRNEWCSHYRLNQIRALCGGVGGDDEPSLVEYFVCAW